MSTNTGHPEADVQQQSATPKVPRPPRPRYAQIHANPLPLTIHPLPPLIPNNPLSLVHLVLAYLGQVLFRPTAHPSPRYTGVFDAATQSVHVTDARSVRALWESGFFGKGSLSRSEPSWLEREKRRSGALALETSEEVTRRRRDERKEFKKERAWKEREAIEETKRREQLGLANGDTPETTEAASADAPHQLGSEPQEPLGTAVVAADSAVPSHAPMAKGPTKVEAKSASSEIKDQEHLQLNMEEALFLASALGVLDIYRPDAEQPIANQDLLPLFAQHATFPPSPNLDARSLPPDNSLLVSYVAYHHFRALGWVVRPGVKFAVDLLLYNRGPVFAHAEFAVLVRPDYSHPHWRTQGKEGAHGKPWHWLHMVNRVQSQVHKTLVL